MRGFRKIEIECLRKLGFLRAKEFVAPQFAREGAIAECRKAEDILRQLLSTGASTRLYVTFGDTEILDIWGPSHLRGNQRPPPSTGGWPGRRRASCFAGAGGTLTFTPTEGAGISLGRLTEFPVTIRLRSGGERLRPDCKRPRRSLKNLLGGGDPAMGAGNVAADICSGSSSPVCRARGGL